MHLNHACVKSNVCVAHKISWTFSLDELDELLNNLVWVWFLGSWAMQMMDLEAMMQLIVLKWEEFIIQWQVKHMQKSLK